jgi:hypothetical protein
MTRLPALLCCALVCATSALAREPADDLRDEAPAPVAREREPTFAWELVMGFGGGLVDPARLPLVVKEGAAGASVAAPFGSTSLLSAGPAWEVRVVQSHARFTLGLQRPFAQFPAGSLDQDVDVGGVTSRLSPRSLSWWNIRLGLGAEATFGRWTPFLDVLGDVQLADGAAVVGTDPARFSSAGFAFLGRAGLRVRLDRTLSLSLAGEVGIVGAPRFGGTLLLGWVLPVR